MNSANGNFSSKIQQKYRFLLQSVANSKEKCPRLTHKQKNNKKTNPQKIGTLY
jgi:hypothetical protein